MRDIVDHHAKALDGSHAKRREVARLGEDNLVHSLKTFRAENRVTGFSRDELLRSRGETALPQRRYPNGCEQVPGQPRQFRAGVHKRFHRALARLSSFVFGATTLTLKMLII
jgi:hypothetical protein